jgi:hypothetical protein
MKKPLSKPERVPLREAWKHEANDFTPWLAEEDNLNTLADALGLPWRRVPFSEHSRQRSHDSRTKSRSHSARPLQG